MPVSADVRTRLLGGDLEVEGRLWDSSNSAVRVLCSTPEGALRAVYKPVRGERPLWDFPTGTLGRREVATAEVDAALGWGIVPPTVWREDGPLGPGSVQAWIEVDASRPPVDVIGSDGAREPWIVIADGEGSHGDRMCLVHEDTLPLRRIALLDAIVNNADRKGGHVLRSMSGSVVGIDHGLTFHVEPKLRTVLWGWAGQAMDEESCRDLAELCRTWSALEGTLEGLLSRAEIASVYLRLEGLLEARRFPEPEGSWPALPWPAM
jgi:uncharacterized repeat protein (TIGR03843 family)